MSSADIILIAILAGVVIVLVWFIKTGNNIKFGKKKDKKKKSGDKDKFKDVIPKEKKEKPAKQVKPEIKKNVKSELEKKEGKEAAKVSKVTKEDFTNNDMKVPQTMLSSEEQEKKAKEFVEPKKSKIPQDNGFKFNKDMDFKPDFKFDDKFKFDDNFNFDDEFKFDDDLLLGNPFSPIGDKSMPSGMSATNELDGLFDEDLFSQSNNIEKESFLSSMEFDEPSMPNPFNEAKVVSKEDALEKHSMQDKFGTVFNGAITKDNLTNEVIVGDILSSPKSRINRRIRERKKM